MQEGRRNPQAAGSGAQLALARRLPSLWRAAFSIPAHHSFLTSACSRSSRLYSEQRLEIVQQMRDDGAELRLLVTPDELQRGLVDVLS